MKVLIFVFLLVSSSAYSGNNSSRRADGEFVYNGPSSNPIHVTPGNGAPPPDYSRPAGSIAAEQLREFGNFLTRLHGIQGGVDEVFRMMMPPEPAFPPPQPEQVPAPVVVEPIPVIAAPIATESVVPVELVPAVVTPVEIVNERLDTNLQNQVDSVPIPYTFHAGPFGDALKHQYTQLYTLRTEGQIRQTSREFGLIATEQSNESYNHNQITEANFYRELGREFLNIAIGLDPISGMGRGAYELVTGNNLVTGDRLTRLERSFAFVVLATGNGGRYAAIAGRAMGRIYQGAHRILVESPGFERAIRQGQNLYRRLGHWGNGHHITRIETAAAANARLQLTNNMPPFQRGSYLVHFTLGNESDFVRVHDLRNQARGWMVRRGEIHGLTPIEIRNKLNLPGTPSLISDVRPPAGTPMSRGLTEYNRWNWHIPTSEGAYIEGQVQYRIEMEYVPESWFSNMREIGDRYL